MAEPVVLSGSSLNTFLRCQRQWEFAYVRRLQRPPSLKAARGIAAHRAAELDMLEKRDNKRHMPRDAVIDVYADTFRVEGADAEEKPDKKETRAIYMDTGSEAVGFWYDEVAPDIEPLHVELHGQFTINGIPYDWTADLVDEGPELGNDGEPVPFAPVGRRIRDWKFVSRTPDSGTEYVLNMVGYAIGARRALGGAEVSRILDHIVLLKKPKYVPMGDGELTDEDIFAFAEIVEGAHSSIQAGNFPPTGLKTNACSWCGYADGTCTAYRRKK